VIRIILLVIAGGMCILPAAGAVTMDLDQAVAHALESDPRIQESRRLVDVARAMLQEATGSDDLFFDVNSFVGLHRGVDGGIYKNGEKTCGVTTECKLRDDNYNFDDGLSLWTALQFKIIKPLYTFGKIENYAAAAQGNVDVKRGDVRLQRIKTRMDVTRAYYGYLAARDTRYLLTDAKSRVEKAIAQVKTWLDEGAGRVKQTDLYTLETGLAILNKSLAQAQAVEEIALDGLKVLTGVGIDGELEVADTSLEMVALPEDPLKDLQDQALSQRPEIAQLEAGLRARRSLVAAKKAEQKPNIYTGVIGSLSWAPNRDTLDNPYILDLYNHAGATPVIGLQWNWETGAQPARVARAQAEWDALIDKAAFAHIGIPFEVAEQYHQVHAYHEAALDLAQGSRSGRRWMIASFADFQAGQEKAKDVMEAFRGYVLVHSDYLSTVNDYNMHVARLKEVIGGYQ
jgi:outer membrane protein